MTLIARQTIKSLPHLPQRRLRVLGKLKGSRLFFQFIEAFCCVGTRTQHVDAMIGGHAQQPSAFVLGALKSDIVVRGIFEERLLEGVLRIGTASQAHETDPPHGIAMLCHGTLYARVVSHAIDVSLYRRRYLRPPPQP